MKFSRIINFPLGLLGLKLIRKNRLELVNLSDIFRDKEFLSVYNEVKANTLVNIERCYALYRSVRYIIRNNIPGDFAECGVWKGGSSMLMAYTLLQMNVKDRKIFMYDTYEGMSKPTDADGEEAISQWTSAVVSDTQNNMCYSSFESVAENMKLTGYPAENIRMIKGKVEDTIPANNPSSLALLRLDTDWYESTIHELHHLYPLLTSKGILIIDDYGAWPGAEKAVNEYFDKTPVIFLQRIDYTGRLIVKP